MSYMLRSFFLTVYTAVVVCTSDTVQFSSNPVCRMSYGVVSTSNTVCRTSYLYCVEFICHMRYYICSWIRTYLCCMLLLFYPCALYVEVLASSVVLFRLGLPDTRIPIRGHIALPRIRIAYRLVYYLVGLWKGQATARSFLPKKWLFLTLRFTF
jgi:hypothetical protein